MKEILRKIQWLCGRHLAMMGKVWEKGWTREKYGKVTKSDHNNRKRNDMTPTLKEWWAWCFLVHWILYGVGTLLLIRRFLEDGVLQVNKKNIGEGCGCGWILDEGNLLNMVDCIIKMTFLFMKKQRFCSHTSILIHESYMTPIVLIIYYIVHYHYMQFHKYTRSLS